MLCEFLVSKAMQSRTGYAHPGCEWSVFLVCHQMAVNTVFFWLSQTKLAICFHCPVYRWISPLTTVKPEQYTICTFWLSFGQILTIYCQWIKVSSARNYLVVEKLLNSIIFLMLRGYHANTFPAGRMALSPKIIHLSPPFHNKREIEYRWGISRTLEENVCSRAITLYCVRLWSLKSDFRHNCPICDTIDPFWLIMSDFRRWWPILESSVWIFPFRSNTQTLLGKYYASKVRLKFATDARNTNKTCILTIRE